MKCPNCKRKGVWSNGQCIVCPYRPWMAPVIPTTPTPGMPVCQTCKTAKDVHDMDGIVCTRCGVQIEEKCRLTSDPCVDETERRACANNSVYDRTIGRVINDTGTVVNQIQGMSKNIPSRYHAMQLQVPMDVRNARKFSKDCRHMCRKLCGDEGAYATCMEVYAEWVASGSKSQNHTWTNAAVIYIGLIRYGRATTYRHISICTIEESAQKAMIENIKQKQWLRGKLEETEEGTEMWKMIRRSIRTVDGDIEFTRKRSSTDYKIKKIRSRHHKIHKILTEGKPIRYEEILIQFVSRAMDGVGTTTPRMRRYVMKYTSAYINRRKVQRFPGRSPRHNHVARIAVTLCRVASAGAPHHLALGNDAGLPMLLLCRALCIVNTSATTDIRAFIRKTMEGSPLLTGEATID